MHQAFRIGTGRIQLMRFGNYVNLLEVVSHSIVVAQLEREVVLV